jgi:hypothetical protein
MHAALLGNLGATIKQNTGHCTVPMQQKKHVLVAAVRVQTPHAANPDWHAPGEALVHASSTRSMSYQLTADLNHK